MKHVLISLSQAEGVVRGNTSTCLSVSLALNQRTKTLREKCQGTREHVNEITVFSGDFVLFSKLS